MADVNDLEHPHQVKLQNHKIMLKLCPKAVSINVTCFLSQGCSTILILYKKWTNRKKKQI